MKPLKAAQKAQKKFKKRSENLKLNGCIVVGRKGINWSKRSGMSAPTQRKLLGGKGGGEKGEMLKTRIISMAGGWKRRHHSNQGEISHISHSKRKVKGKGM